jgi:hypothetical protein
LCVHVAARDRGKRWKEQQSKRTAAAASTTPPSLSALPSLTVTAPHRTQQPHLVRHSISLPVSPFPQLKPTESTRLLPASPVSTTAAPTPRPPRTPRITPGGPPAGAATNPEAARSTRQRAPRRSISGSDLPPAGSNSVRSLCDFDPPPALPYAGIYALGAVADGWLVSSRYSWFLCFGYFPQGPGASVIVS